MRRSVLVAVTFYIIKDFFFMVYIKKKALLNLLWYCFCLVACFCFFFLGGGAGNKTRRILAPWPGIKPTPPPLEGRVLTANHWGRPWDTSKKGLMISWFWKECGAFPLHPSLFLWAHCAGEECVPFLVASLWLLSPQSSTCSTWLPWGSAAPS